MKIELTREQAKKLMLESEAGREMILDILFADTYVTLPNGAKFFRSKALEYAKVARAGNVIQAIKDLRGETGLGLKESKDTIEDWRDNLR